MQHDWYDFKGLTCCRNCGVVRRADGQNRPCKERILSLVDRMAQAFRARIAEWGPPKSVRINQQVDLPAHVPQSLVKVSAHWPNHRQWGYLVPPGHVAELVAAATSSGLLPPEKAPCKSS